MKIFLGALRKKYDLALLEESQLNEKIAGLETDVSNLESKVEEANTQVPLIVSALSSKGISVPSSDRVLSKLSSYISKLVVGVTGTQTGSKTWWMEDKSFVYTGSFAFPKQFKTTPTVTLSCTKKLASYKITRVTTASFNYQFQLANSDGSSGTLSYTAKC